MKYLRLYLHFVRFSFGRAMEFRFDFSLKIIMDCFYYVMHLSIFKILFNNTSTLAGWTEDQGMVFISSVLLIDAIHMTLFASNMWNIPFLVNRGDLDVYITRPVSTLFFISLRDFAANSFINLLIASAIFITTLSRLQVDYSFFNLLGYIALIINGVLLHYVMQMLFIIPVFWTQSNKGFNEIFFSLGLAMERPDLIYRGFVRIIFTFVIPMGLVASLPARWFFGPHTPYLTLHLLGITAVMWGLMLFFWKRGLRAYSSASS